MSRFWEPNNGVRSSIAESDADAEVEGTLEVSNKLSGFTSLLASSNKSYYFITSSEDLFQPSFPFIITVGLGYLVENSHFHSGVEPTGGMVG